MLTNKNTSKIENLLKILSASLLIIVTIYFPFFIADSVFWKKWISPRFDGGNLSQSIRSNEEGLIESVEYLNPTTYRLKLRDAERGDIISLYDDYDAYWYAREIGIDKREGGIIISSPHRSNVNNFRLRYDGDYTLEIFYAPKRWVEVGVITVVLSIIFLAVFNYVLKRK